MSQTYAAWPRVSCWRSRAIDLWSLPVVPYGDDCLGDERGLVPDGSIATVPPFRNRLLSSLSSESLERIGDQLEFIELPLRYSLVEANEPTTYVHFMESGLASSVAASADEDEQIEVGHIGFEGMTGLHLVLGVDRTPTQTLMPVEETAFRLSADGLAKAMAEDSALHALLLRYVHTFQLQLAYSALANGRYSIPERLARWLLMCHDRLGSGGMRLTHEFLALMLGVRRSGVTNEIHILEGIHAIKATRASIDILDRAKLEDVAGGAYGVARS